MMLDIALETYTKQVEGPYSSDVGVASPRQVELPVAEHGAQPVSEAGPDGGIRAQAQPAMHDAQRAK